MNNSSNKIYRANRDDPPFFQGSDLGFRRICNMRLSAEPEGVPVDPNKMALLPATADELFWDDRLREFQWKGALVTMLAGTRDENSPLCALRDHEATIVRVIYDFIGSHWAKHVKYTVPAYLVGVADVGRERCEYMQFNHGRTGTSSFNYQRRVIKQDSNKTSNGFKDGFVAYARVGQVKFPEPADRNVNMMPFIFGDKDSLPSYLQCYFPLIEKCPYLKDDIGQVGYLTVHESYVDVGVAQRREGLHIESPGIFSDNIITSSFSPGVEHAWGAGVFWGPDRYDGGIYMASSVSGTSKVWDALIDNKIPGIVDRHGGCEYLRGIIGEETTLEAGELIWMTDMTPHEVLPQKESGFRQFFRVITPSVTHWFADHSTQNPKVPLPDNVKVVHGNKFERKDCA